MRVLAIEEFGQDQSHGRAEDRHDHEGRESARKDREAIVFHGQDRRNKKGFIADFGGENHGGGARKGLPEALFGIVHKGCPKGELSLGRRYHVLVFQFRKELVQRHVVFRAIDEAVVVGVGDAEPVGGGGGGAS